MPETRKAAKDITDIHVICDEYAGYKYEMLFADKPPREREINFPAFIGIPLKIILEVCMREYSMTQEELFENLELTSHVCHWVEDTITTRLKE